MVTPARRAVVLVLSLAAALPACGSRSSLDQRAELCTDLLHLRATVTMLTQPSEDATVGQIRSALDKLDPTFEQVESSDVVSEYDEKILAQAQYDYRSVIASLGDDEPLEIVGSGAGGPAARLGAAFEGLMVDLSCAQAAAGPS